MQKKERKERKDREKGKGGGEEGRTDLVLDRARDNGMVEQNDNLPLPALGTPHASLLSG
jgi:hypothetical protein